METPRRAAKRKRIFQSSRIKILTPKERVIKALEHREGDRVPIGEMYMSSAPIEKILGRETFLGCVEDIWRVSKARWDGREEEILKSQKKDLVALVNQLEWDFVSIESCCIATDFMPRMKVIEEKDDKIKCQDPMGNIWLIQPLTGHQVIIKYAQKSDMPWRLGGLNAAELEFTKHIIDKLGNTHFIVVHADGTFPQLGGMENFLMKMITEPSFVKKAIQVSTEMAIERGKKLIQLGADAVLMGTDWCYKGGPIMGPKLFQEYLFPSLKQHCKEFHKAGAYVIKHTDGNTWPILDMEIEAGVDGIHGIEPTAGMDIKKLKQKYGQQLCFFGNIECGETLTNAPIEQVISEVRYVLKWGAPGGGLVVTSSNSLHRGVKYDNYMAMLRTVKTEGIYPLKI